MKSLIALFSAVAIMASVTGFAETAKTDHKKPAKPAKTSKQAKTKLVEVTTCPITGEKVTDMKAGGSEVVGNYNVHFCCGGCKPNFDKLSASEKLKKAAEFSKKNPSAAKKS